MIEMYKLTNQFYDSNAIDRLFEPNARISRGNQRVMSKKAIESRRNCFTVRAAKDWNNLPEEEMSIGTMELVPEATPVDQKT